MTKTAAWHFPYALFEAQLGEYPLRHGTMRMMLYHPDKPNRQSPHAQDELYIIEAGRGTFSHAGEVKSFGPGDVIFVRAGTEHRFEDFDSTLRAWVMFWGPPGGEKEE